MVGQLRGPGDRRGAAAGISEHNRTTASPPTWENAVARHDATYAAVCSPSYAPWSPSPRVPADDPSLTHPTGRLPGASRSSPSTPIPTTRSLLTGGTLARAAAEGHRVVLVTATCGERGLAGAATAPAPSWPAPEPS